MHESKLFGTELQNIYPKEQIEEIQLTKARFQSDQYLRYEHRGLARK